MKKLLLFVGMILSFPAFQSEAQETNVKSITEILNADGTIQKGAEGSFSAQGYEMRYGKNGEPIFLPKIQDIKEGTWSALGTGINNGAAGQVYALAVLGDNLFVGGTFISAGGLSANRIARYNISTNTWYTLGTGSSVGVNWDVHAIAVSGDDVFVGGKFTQAGGIEANRVARYNLTTNTWSSLGTGTSNGVNNWVFALAVSGENLVVGGYFTQAGGVSANYLALYNLTTNTWHTLGTGASNGVTGYVYALAVLGENLFVGGQFSQAFNISRYNLSTNTWHALGNFGGSGTNGTIFAIAVSGDNVIAGGSFTQAGAVRTSNVARYNLTDDAWYVLGTGSSHGVNNTVSSLAVSGDNVFVGGLLSTAAGSVGARRVARYNLTTNTWHSLGTGTNDGVSDGDIGTTRTTVNAIVVLGNDVIVGGSFRKAGVTQANHVARYTESVTSVEENISLPQSYILHQNYPNPFNPSTTISFTIPNSEFVTLKVYDMLGREVTTLVNDNLTAGSHSFNFDASNLTSGVYFYKLQAGKFSEIKKMMLVK